MPVTVHNSSYALTETDRLKRYIVLPVMYTIQRNRCTTVKIRKNNNFFVAHKTNQAFFVQCVNSPQFIHRCKEGGNTIFDEKRQQCIYDCKTGP